MLMALLFLVDTRYLAIGIAVVGLAILALGLVAAWFDQQAALQSDRELARFRQLTDATFSGVFVYRDNIILGSERCVLRLHGQRTVRTDRPYGRRLRGARIPRAPGGAGPRRPARECRSCVISSPARGARSKLITRMVDYRGGKASMIALRDITDRKRRICCAPRSTAS